MFPGFVHIYRDSDKFVHLYFFSGIDDENKPIYKDIDLSNVSFTYTCSKNNNSIDYKFDNKSIVRIKCNLVPTTSGKQIEKKTLSLKRNDRIDTKI